jgi:sodium-dependent phosphate cotransporter
MESLEKQNQPAKRKLLNYGWVFLSLLLFIFAIDLLTVAIGKINSGLALEILQ